MFSGSPIVPSHMQLPINTLLCVQSQNLSIAPIATSYPNNTTKAGLLQKHNG